MDYEKNTLEIFQIKDRIVEVGQLHFSYQIKDSATAVKLTGKYMQVWAVQKNQSLKLQAVAEGYFSNVEQPAVWVVAKSGTVTPNATANKSLAHQLQALNTLMEEAVRNRDGNLRADFFTDDASFMPFADTTKTGMQVLRPYLILYNSYPVTIDSINIYNMGAEDMGSYVIEYPLFRVQWHNSGGSGRGSGKGIRLWRREKDCSLKIFREIGLHNYPE